MCGIAGFWSVDRVPRDPQDVLHRMGSTLRHRGPDDEGFWWDPQVGVGLAHRRLSIIDLSAEGHQPMVSASGRYVIVYNGEVYNFEELRCEFTKRGVSFRGGSDTEVMLAAIEAGGVEQAVRTFAGMFAFGLFDRTTKQLHLVRDRLGEKPLYVARFGPHLLFASELKALRAHPEWEGRIDRDALSLLLRHNYIPTPYTIYAGVQKIRPGTIVTFAAPDALPAVSTYWSASEAVRLGLAHSTPRADEEYVAELDALLRGVIKREMIADVPLGAFLSGGIDSSLIVALMQAQSERPIRTFTIGFRERGYNEADHASAIARHLRTDHTELYVTPEELLAVVPKLPTLYDEPFADSSQVPTYSISQLARQHVKVSLSGDGGDELFGGYMRYFVGGRLRRWLRPVPHGLRRAAAHVIRSVSPRRWNSALDVLSLGKRQLLPWSLSGDRLHKLADVLESGTDRDAYRYLVSHWQKPDEVVLGAHEHPTVLTERGAAVESLTQWMMSMDLVSYLPDDILVKVDRASMGVSLESRAPYLDHNIVEFAWRLPPQLKVRGGQGKWILRQVLDRYVPRRLVERPKMGFGIPLDTWLRGPLREWAEGLIDPARLHREGYLNPVVIQTKWIEHQAGTHNWQYHLWDVLMFQSWLEEQ